MRRAYVRRSRTTGSEVNTDTYARKQYIHEGRDVTYRRRGLDDAGRTYVGKDEWVSSILCVRDMLSPRRSRISTNCPAVMRDTNRAGTGSMAIDRLRAWDAGVTMGGIGTGATTGDCIDCVTATLVAGVVLMHPVGWNRAGIVPVAVGPGRTPSWRGGPVANKTSWKPESRATGKLRGGEVTPARQNSVLPCVQQHPTHTYNK